VALGFWVGGGGDTVGGLSLLGVFFLASVTFGFWGFIVGFWGG